MDATACNCMRKLPDIEGCAGIEEHSKVSTEHHDVPTVDDCKVTVESDESDATSLNTT